MRGVDVVEFRPTPDQYAWTFGGVAPTHRITPGTALKLWTEDAFSGRLQRTSDLPSQVLDMTQVNPQTGPFYVEGAEPGDTLALHIVDLTPARDWAASSTIPFFGALTGTDRTALLNEPLPEQTWIYQLDRAKGTVLFEAQRSQLSLELPIAPMLGTVGVAPPGREVRSSLVPDTFGGNMDTPEMRAGTTVFLGVNVPGALFSVGDGHYRQGEGESCGTAVEGAMDVTLIVELVKGGGAGVAAPGARRALRRRRLVAPAGGRLAGQPGRHDPLARGPVRSRPAGRLPAPHPGEPVAAGQRLRHQLQRGHEDREVAAPRRRRLRRHAPPPARAGRSPQLRRTPSMDLQLAGRTALVTGGTKGIGRAVVEGLAAEGAKVAFCARTDTDVRKAEDELRAAGHDVTGTAVDVADADALTGWVAASAEHYGGIDVVVANVSALAIGTDPDHWRNSFEVDLMHTVRMVDAALPHLVASGVGIDRRGLQRVRAGRSTSPPARTA